MGRLGCCDCKGRNQECVCTSFLADGMRLHFVGATKDAFYGLPSSMAALCTHNCTSRVWQNLKYVADKNVTVDGVEYSKRFICDVPKKPGAKLWLGCVKEINGVAVNFIRPWWGGINHVYLKPDWYFLWNYDKPERTFGRSSPAWLTVNNQIYGGDFWSPFFPVWTFQAPPSGVDVKLEHGHTLDGSVFTELRNSKINLNHKDYTDTVCNLQNRWGICGFMPIGKLSFGQEFIQSFIPPTDEGFDSASYEQYDVVSGMLPGYRPFSFIPKTGDTQLVAFPTFGNPIYQNGLGFRTELRITSRRNGPTRTIYVRFVHSEHRKINTGFGDYWIRILVASSEQYYTIDNCQDNVEFNFPVTVIKFYQGRNDQVVYNCKFNYSYAFL